MPIPVKVEFSIALAENMEPLIICVCGGAESGINTIWLREFKTLTVIKLGSIIASTILTVVAFPLWLCRALSGNLSQLGRSALNAY